MLWVDPLSIHFIISVCRLKFYTGMDSVCFYVAAPSVIMLPLHHQDHSSFTSPSYIFITLQRNSNFRVYLYEK